MSLSQAEIGLLVEEIRPLVGSSTLQRVLEPDDRTIALRLREPGETHFLLVDTSRDATRLHFVDEKPDQPGAPSSFAMLLRKWLHGAPFTGIRQIQGDRVVELEFAVVDPRVERDDDSPERTPAYLVCELAGRVGNVFLLDSDRHIVGRQTDEAIASRSFERGEQWSPPPPPPDPEVGSEVRWNLESLDPSSHRRSAAVAERYRQRLRRRRRDELAADLKSGLEHQLERLERRIEHVEGDLEEIENADEYRKRAELLQSAYGEVERGAESVEIEDYYRDGMPTVEIPLDPRKDLQENIDHYYHQASRYEQAREKVEERLLESIEQRDRIEEVLEDHRAGELPEDPDELERLQSEWVDAGLLPEPTPEQTERRKEEDSRPHRVYRSKSGRRILVGKSASENDTLTTKIARGRDVWLHARDWAGAHVVLRMHRKGESPEQDDLIDAATLAAHFSNGREDSVVEVGYTRAKHVRKTGDLPPGRVFVSNEKTIAVEIKKERLERLLETLE